MPSRITPISILADDLTGASDACAPLVAAYGTGHVSLSVEAPERTRDVLSVDGNLRELASTKAQETFASFATLVKAGGRSGGLVYLKIDSATRGNIARDVSLLLRAMPRFRGAVVAPAYPANGRLFHDGRAILGNRPQGPCLRTAFEKAGYQVAVLSDYSGGEPAISDQIEACLDEGCRIVLADTRSGDDLAKLAPVMLERRGQLLSVGSAGLVEAMAGTRGAVVPLPADQLTCIFGTRAEIARTQLERLERDRGAIRYSRRPRDWRAIGEGGSSAAFTAMLETDLPRIIDIAADEEAAPLERPVDSLARVVVPHLGRMGVVLLSGGDTARAILKRLGIGAFDVTGVFENGMPICRSEALPLPFLMKSGGFGDDETLLRLADYIARTETHA